MLSLKAWQLQPGSNAMQSCVPQTMEGQFSELTWGLHREDMAKQKGIRQHDPWMAVTSEPFQMLRETEGHKSTNGLVIGLRLQLTGISAKPFGKVTSPPLTANYERALAFPLACGSRVSLGQDLACSSPTSMTTASPA